MKKAKDTYDSKGLFRKTGRALGDFGPAVVDKLDQAPDEMFIGVVCRGLKLLFGVAIQLAEKRNKILEAFKDIPDLVTRVAEYDKLYDQDSDYVALRETFDECLLTSIGKSIQWLVKPSIWKSIEVIIKGPFAAQSVENLMDEVQSRSNNLKSRMEYIDRSRLKYISIDAESAARQEGTLAGLKELNFKVGEMQDLLKQKNKDYAEAQIKKLKKDLLQARVANTLVSSLLETTKKRRSQHILPVMRYKPANNSKLDVAPRYLQQAELTSFMAIPDTSSDILTILQNSARLDIQQMRLAHGVANSTSFRGWSDATRGILFLNGSGDLIAARESPISALLASLMIETIDDPTITVLYFFCGLHCDASGVVSGPKGLVRSLIAQLSNKGDFNLDFINTRDKREEIRDHDMRRLCETFSAMAYQLPADHEFCCIIDGISWLETPRWREDLVATVAFLCYLSVDPRCQARFKLLISCPVRSLMLTRELKQYGGVASVIEVGSMRMTEREVPSERELWDMSARQR